ncbi:STAS domain-containing protein [Candidatus Manganitrophus noduliformans]|uniref:STAS domain-containing protein n=1 Tax=Candidatus Manganitrophus noduliformans TaxID=2606439 RepID=A0A7X6DN85_9BACT|nr:STAS domain-containing protein [Candidatus Manganitrophus noduliformans]NKE70245.1 hypothetical protein [Candidatus Manganitrophus noduliformans]
MFKVSLVDSDEKTITLKLEGRIVGPWVNVLRGESDRWFSQQRRLILDFSEVTFIDSEGIDLAHALMRKGIHLVGFSLFLSEILEKARPE